MEERDGHIFSVKWISVKRRQCLWVSNPPKNASESERKIAEEVAEWIDDIQTLKCFYLMQWMVLGMVILAKKFEWHQLGNLMASEKF
jgi:phage gp29-like protein